jgi:endonuclease/exonuclease/phosphatase family metal-dependent hydrolase
MQRLRVMTYNIHAARHLERVTEVIRSANADLVALQDVNNDRATDVATALQMEMRFASCGICTLASPRLPIVESRELRLPQRHDDEQRCALLTTHRWDGGTLELLNTHLSVIFRERPHQVAAIAQEMLGEALVIAGDFNMTPWSSAFKVLRRGLTSATRFARTWPAPAPLIPLDHILYRGRLELVEGRAWTGGGARRASDHLPVVAELEHVPLAA